MASNYDKRSQINILATALTVIFLMMSLFCFQYAILLTIVVAVFMKYVLHTIDLQSVNPWENKAVYILYSELVMGK